MHITELFTKNKPVISFEIFPPKKDDDIITVYNTIDELVELNPDFISVTYGAGGVGSNKTVEISSVIKNRYGIEALAHLTCISSSFDTLETTIRQLRDNNIENILALRGDLPKEQIEGERYNYAVDLIREINKYEGFSIGAAAYPESHIQCEDIRVNAIHLKQKVNAGAEYLITQLFFDNKLFYDFINLKNKLSIDVPVSAGIMPILSRKQIEKMIFMCGVSLPSSIIRLLYKYEHSPESLRKAGIEYAAEQVLDLIANGVDGVHIYTMNQPEIAKGILGAIQPYRATERCIG